ncbi:hypothetical protein Tco_1371415 [Tanacetum coccineum]
MANIRTCNKHNMIACVEKTEHNADFHQIVDYLTGCSINYSLLVNPDLIGPWLQQFWATASLRSINEVPHIRAMVAGKRVLISEETIRADLLFDDTDGIDCFPKQVIWDSLRSDIGYEGPKSTSWEQFGTNIASALVGLATNQKFNFSLMIMNGMLGHIANVTLPQEVITKLAAEEAHSESLHSRAESSPRDAQGTPAQSDAQASISQGTAEAQGTADIPQSPNDYTPTDESQTSGGDERQEAKEEGVFSQTGETQGTDTQGTVPKDKGKGILVEEPKKKKLTLQQIRALETTNDEEVARKIQAEWDAEEERKRIRPTQEVEPEEQFKVDEVLADISFNISRPRALETTNDEEVARKIQAEWDAEEERKRLEDLKKAKPKTILKKPTSLAQERNQMMSFLKGQGYKNLQKLRYPQMKELYDKVQESIKDSFKDFIPMGSEREKQMLQERDAKRLLRKRKATISEEQPSKKLKLRTETIDELRNYLRIVDFEKSAQDRESLEAISMITELKVIDSPDGEYLIIYRANHHFRAFDTLWDILHILDRQDLYHLYRVVQDYYEHIPPTGLGLVLLGDLTTIWETPETSDDDFWKNQEDWEIIRWRLNDSSGVHTLELEDGTMIHMMAERRYPLSRELMIRVLDHDMEVEEESDIAITLIHLFILWTTEDGDNS